MSKDAAPKPTKGKVDSASLKSDVQAFASRLGLAPSAGGGFDDSDFRPDKAKQRIGAAADRHGKGREARQQQQAGTHRDARKDFGQGSKGPNQRNDRFAPAQNNRRDGEGFRNGQAKRFPGGSANGRSAYQTQQDGYKRSAQAQQAGDRRNPNAQNDEAVRSRNWNSGVGPRPGAGPLLAAGEVAGAVARSMLPRDEPNVWYVAAADQPKLAAGTDAQPLSEDEVRRRRHRCRWFWVTQASFSWGPS